MLLGNVNNKEEKEKDHLESFYFGSSFLELLILTKKI